MAANRIGIRRAAPAKAPSQVMSQVITFCESPSTGGTISIHTMHGDVRVPYTRDEMAADVAKRIADVIPGATVDGATVTLPPAIERKVGKPMIRRKLAVKGPWKRGR